jgi:hypothetical protein
MFIKSLHTNTNTSVKTTDQRFREAYYLPHQGDERGWTLVVDAVLTSETVVSSYEIAVHNIPEDFILAAVRAISLTSVKVY